MGVIENGTVSGVLPTVEAFAVHYPGYPSSTARAVETLGGTEGILKARSSNTNKLELRFRHDDPYSHPAFGELHPCNNFLLKISKKKSNGDEGQVCADVVARVPEAYHFQGMADYQHVVAVHADAAKQRKKRKRHWTEVEDPHFEKGGLMDVDQEDVMIMLPPLFSPKDMPEDLVLRPAPTSTSKVKHDVAQQELKVKSFFQLKWQTRRLRILIFLVH